MSDQANFGKPLLGESFVSLLDAVETIACQIQMSDPYVDSYRDTKLDENEFVTMLNRWPVKTGFQRSEAANIFIRHLANGPAAQRPRWFDTVLGFPLADEKIAGEGMTELARMARWAENYKRWYSSLRWHQPNVETTEETSPAFELLPRVGQIGFDRNELIHFLNHNHIKHCLGEVISESESAITESPEPTQAPARPSSNKPQSFRDAMGKFIFDFRATLPEGYQDNEAYVFSEMKRIACDETIPKEKKFPLLDYVEGKGIKWEKGDARLL